MGNVSSLPDYCIDQPQQFALLLGFYTINVKETEKEREREMKYNSVNEVEGLYSQTLYLEKAVTYNVINEVATVKVEQAQYAP